MSVADGVVSDVMQTEVVSLTAGDRLDLVEDIMRLGIKSIAIPPLGSGLGGLDWVEVRPRIEAALKDIDGLRVIIFEPVVHRRGDAVGDTRRDT